MATFSFSRNASIKVKIPQVATGVFELGITGYKSGSHYAVKCTLKTAYTSGVAANLKLQKYEGGEWHTLRELNTSSIPKNPGTGNVMGDGLWNTSFDDIAISGRTQMRVRAKVAGYDFFATDSWNENNI